MTVKYHGRRTGRSDEGLTLEISSRWSTKFTIATHLINLFLYYDKGLGKESTDNVKSVSKNM